VVHQLAQLLLQQGHRSLSRRLSSTASGTRVMDMTELLELLEGWRRVAWMTAEPGRSGERMAITSRLA
jgi:hypothetical protein